MYALIVDVGFEMYTLHPGVCTRVGQYTVNALEDFDFNSIHCRRQLIFSLDKSQKDIVNFTTAPIIFKIHEAMGEMKRAKVNDHWLSPKGQEELKKMSEDQTRKGLNIFDYAPATKASLCPMTAPEDEWYEVELTADTAPVTQ